MSGEFQLGEWVISPQLNSFRKNGHTVHLEPKVMQVLLCLAETQDVVSKDELMRRVWAETFVTDDVLTRSISELRKVFSDNPKAPRYIQTIPKGGYRLLVQAREVIVEPIKPAPQDKPPSKAASSDKSHHTLTLTIIGALALLSITYVVFQYSSSSGRPRSREMLAVLPFQNLSNDPQQDFFADGLTAEMIAQFGRLSSSQLGVIAWTSMAIYKRTQKTQDEIANELGATYLLNGTVRRSGNKVRITAELVQTGRRAHVWSNEYDGNLEDVLGLQTRVAREIADEIRVELTPEEQARFWSRPPPVNGEGYEVYLKAKAEREGSPESTQKKTEHLRQAILLNPGFAPQYVELAMTNRSLASRGMADPKSSYATARDAVARALELDPNSGSAHRELGWIEWRYEWDFPAAERDLKKALDLSPNDASAHDIYALFLKSMGRYQEALAQSNRAIELNPMEPYSRANAGSLLAMTKRYEEANLQFQRGIQVNPQEPYVWERLGPVLLMQGMKEEAIEALEKARDYSGGQQDKIAWLGYAYALSHREADARRMLDQLMGMKANHRYVSEFHMALIYLALKDRQSCLNSLEEAFDRRDEYLVYLNVLPEFRPLDGNPRFERLKARIGFPQMTSKLW
jgi:TolB-like protein/DNA-binding winged helix-turn-helix (wHTH) protein/tetratricopeptide (TPR) repeat protein